MKRSEIQIPVDGVTIAAWHYAAAGSDSRPCVVMAHGFCGTRDAGLAGFGERFAEAGIDTLCFDYRGFGASGGRTRQVVDFPGQLRDYHAAIDTAQQLPHVNGVAVWGTSLSGGHVFALAAQRPDLIGAIALTPIVDGRKSVLRMSRSIRPYAAIRLGASAIRDAIRARAGRPPVLVPAAGPPRSAAMLTTPDALPGYLAIAQDAPLWRNEFAARVLLDVPRYRPGLHADRISCRMLVQIAAADRNAPPDLAKAAARRADALVNEYAGAGHFDVYDTGSAFDAVVTDQISFLASLTERTAS
ncbi:alpha/beta hydrolase [[Mycobacterium] crassicus]|uniref:Alpha/beta fold hydrolase n=1 Tax=[Mycobacterium] crassicus TaxID=2872309 RepID=A0ABU5XFV2_9MYCO|nr:alpha/beta hydrolase [Mycolicibacter sp. MYC098]MEB3020864.1 alpha/beta fold hydrolase [Mycolicibacter sp. MYC098]